uniref:Uncharacterized protein n=1 Tax=Monopterus albus TaxID=43700 RepID=A0A3Q3JS17_MONAL
TPGRMWPGCGGSNIVEDDLYCQPQRVCVDCGSVVSEGVLASEPVVGPVVTYSRTTAVAKKPCLQRVKAMCRILMVHREIEQLSQTYYNKAYQHESFLKVSLQKKEVLAGCCVLVSCRLLNWPITMATILCLINADPTLVFYGFAHLDQTFPYNKLILHKTLMSCRKSTDTAIITCAFPTMKSSTLCCGKKDYYTKTPVSLHCTD